MKSAILQKDILTEIYFDMENLIYDVVWKFIAKYGGEFEELKAEANLLFVLAVDIYNNAKGNLTTWLHFYIWQGLMRVKQVEWQQKHYELYEEIASKKAPSRLYEILNELSSDAKTITKIILEPPDGLTSEDLEKGFNACQTRIYIKKYLKIKLGWTGKRIKESFTEIREIIND